MQNPELIRESSKPHSKVPEWVFMFSDIATQPLGSATLLPLCFTNHLLFQILLWQQRQSCHGTTAKGVGKITWEDDTWSYRCREILNSWWQWIQLSHGPHTVTISHIMFSSFHTSVLRPVTLLSIWWTGEVSIYTEVLTTYTHYVIKSAMFSTQLSFK